MTQDFIALLAALAGLLLPVGIGARWLLSHIDGKAAASALAEAKARDALSDQLRKEIDELRGDLRRLEKDKALFARRIYQLEHFIHSMPGVNIPSLEGWPPV